MHTYGAVLFIHLLGVVMLFGAIAITGRSVASLSRADSVDHLRLWAGVTRTTAPMFPVAFVLILASGLYLANDQWSLSQPWVVVGIASVVVMGAVGGGVIGRILAAVGRAAASSRDGTVPAEAARLAGSAVLRGSLLGMSGMAVGMLWIMTNKPGWAGSVSVVAALGAVGAIGAFIARRGNTARSPEPA